MNTQVREMFGEKVPAIAGIGNQAVTDLIHTADGVDNRRGSAGSIELSTGSD